MANKKISQLPAFSGTPASTDVVPMVDVSGTATTKKVSLANIVNLANVGNLRAANNLSDLADASSARGNLSLGTAAVLSTGIANTNVPKFTSGVADDDFLRVAGTDIEGRSATEVKSDLGLGTAATKAVGTADTNVIAVSSGVVDLGGNKLEDFDASIDADKTADHTLVASDNGKVIVMNKASAVTVTVPSGLGAGFNCSFVQKGAGQVSFDNNSGATTINNRQSHTKIYGQYGVASLVSYADNVFVLAGDTAS